MDPGIKKEFYKVFYVASFLFITIFFILPYLVQVSTYFHEKSHQKALDKYGIPSTYNVNLIATIPNFYNPRVNKLGVTNFDFNEYKTLDKFQRAEVNQAGMISDLRFLFLIGIYLALINIYMFYKVRIRKDYNLVWCLAVNWILFMWLLALIQITVSNMSYNSGDFYHLINFLNVCI